MEAHLDGEAGAVGHLADLQGWAQGRGKHHLTLHQVESA